MIANATDRLAKSMNDPYDGAILVFVVLVNDTHVCCFHLLTKRETNISSSVKAKQQHEGHEREPLC